VQFLCGRASGRDLFEPSGHIRVFKHGIKRPKAFGTLRMILSGAVVQVPVVLDNTGLLFTGHGLENLGGPITFPACTMQITRKQKPFPWSRIIGKCGRPVNFEGIFSGDIFP